MSKTDKSPVRNCPICGERAMSVSNEPLTVDFRDVAYVVDGFSYEACAACGEKLFRPRQLDDINRCAVSMAREDRSLLTPEQIRQLRAELGLTQVQLEDILGVGPKTVTRWEKGTVFQSAVADKFMRKLWEHPQAFGVPGASLDALRSDLSALTVDERLQLAEDLWESIRAESADVPLTPAQKAELDRRLDELEHDSDSREAWEDVRERLRTGLSHRG